MTHNSRPDIWPRRTTGYNEGREQPEGIRGRMPGRGPLGRPMPNGAPREPWPGPDLSRIVPAPALWRSVHRGGRVRRGALPTVPPCAPEVGDTHPPRLARTRAWAQACRGVGTRPRHGAAVFAPRRSRFVREHPAAPPGTAAGVRPPQLGSAPRSNQAPAAIGAAACCGGLRHQRYDHWRGYCW